MRCNDPVITYLKAFGYSVIRLPKTDVAPLQLLARSGRTLDRIGEVTTVFNAGDAGLPSIDSHLAANISGQRTSQLNIGIGLSILGSVIAAMGGSRLGLDVKYSHARTVAFEFEQVSEDSIEIARLDQFLAAADVNVNSRHVSTLLEADDLYVTSAIIKSNKFALEAKTSHGEDATVSIPEIQQVIGAEISVSGQSENTARVSYEGKVPLAFGFQAVRLFYEEGRYTAFEPLEPAKTGLRALDQAADDGAERFVSEGPFAVLRTD